MADQQQPSSTPAQGQGTPLRPAQHQKPTGQRSSRARGAHTRSKKNPGKRTHQGG